MEGMAASQLAHGALRCLIDECSILPVQRGDGGNPRRGEVVVTEGACGGNILWQHCGDIFCADDVELAEDVSTLSLTASRFYASDAVATGEDGEDEEESENDGEFEVPPFGAIAQEQRLCKTCLWEIVSALRLCVGAFVVAEVGCDVLEANFQGFEEATLAKLGNHFGVDLVDVLFSEVACSETSCTYEHSFILEGDEEKY